MPGRSGLPIVDHPEDVDADRRRRGERRVRRDRPRAAGLAGRGGGDGGRPRPRDPRRRRRATCRGARLHLTHLSTAGALDARPRGQGAPACRSPATSRRITWRSPTSGSPGRGAGPGRRSAEAGRTRGATGRSSPRRSTRRCGSTRRCASPTMRRPAWRPSLDGTADAIATDHAPHTEVDKDGRVRPGRERHQRASRRRSGWSSRPSTRAAPARAGDRGADDRPGRVLGPRCVSTPPAIVEGAPADLVVFDRSRAWTVSRRRAGVEGQEHAAARSGAPWPRPDDHRRRPARLRGLRDISRSARSASRRSSGSPSGPGVAHARRSAKVRSMSRPAELADYEERAVLARDDARAARSARARPARHRRRRRHRRWLHRARGGPRAGRRGASVVLLEAEHARLGRLDAERRHRAIPASSGAPRARRSATARSSARASTASRSRRTTLVATLIGRRGHRRRLPRVRLPRARLGAVPRRDFDRRPRTRSRRSASPAHVVPRDELRDEIGTDAYHGGLVVEAGGGAPPGEVLRGSRVARRARRRRPPRGRPGPVDPAPGGRPLRRRDRARRDPRPRRPRRHERLHGRRRPRAAAPDHPDRQLHHRHRAAARGPRARALADAAGCSSTRRTSCTTGTCHADRRMLFGGRALVLPTIDRRGRRALLQRGMVEVHPQLAGTASVRVGRQGRLHVRPDAACRALGRA